MTKNEIRAVGIILLAIVVVSFFNLRSSEVLARDIQRKNDVKHIAAALDEYRRDMGSYPPAKDGKIAACGDPLDPQPCAWGKDNIGEYITPLPEDPLAPPLHYSYLYISNARDYQVFTALERTTDDEYNESISRRNLKCGPKICNFGVGSGNIPPSIDLDTYDYESTESADEK